MIIGLVGKPSSGKSSFFKAATMIDVKISPIPFTTIKPNIGIGYVISNCVCKKLRIKCNPKNGRCIEGKRFIPVKIIDVAGLVPNAHEGRGMGNKFLDDLRQADILIHIIDSSGTTDEEGNQTNNHNPMRDIEFLEREIDYWIYSIIQKSDTLLSHAKSNSEIIKILFDQLSGLSIKNKDIENALSKFNNPISTDFATTLREKSKPIIISANKCDLKSSKNNVEKLIKSLSAIPTSAEAEITLNKANENGFINYISGGDFKISKNINKEQEKALKIIKDNVIDKFESTGIQKCLNKAVFESLEYVAVYPVANPNKFSDKDGNILPDVYLVPKGTNVKELAFKIHTSIGENFIAGINARTKKKLSSNYEIQHNDIIEIAFAK